MIEIPKPKDRTNLDLLELVCQLHSRALQYPSKKMHDAYWEARRELEARLEQKELQQHSVMQAEASASAKGAAVGKERGPKGVSDGERCPSCKSTNLLDIDDHFTKCLDCEFSFVGG